MGLLGVLIAIFILLLINAVFAAYEMALASVSKARLQALVNQNMHGAQAALFMKQRMEASLALVQVGITLVGALAAAMGGVEIEEILTPFLRRWLAIPHAVAEALSVALFVLPLTAFSIIFAELVPKVFAINNKEWVALKLSPVMRSLFFFGYPIVSAFERIVKWFSALGQRHGPKSTTLAQPTTLHELHAAVSLARTARLIGARQEKIVLSTAQLAFRPISHIMLPASDIAMISLDSTLNEALIRAHLDMHTRFPVCGTEGDPQTIQGYINFKDIVAALKINPSDPTLRGIIRPIKRVNENVPISQVLEEMIHDKVHIALVGSPEQKVLGMVTLEDIIEEMVGEIEDEFDRLPSHVHPAGAGWIMGGGVPMNIVSNTLGIPTPIPPAGERVPTLAEWSERLLNHPPHGGEVIRNGDIQIFIRKLRRKKVAEAMVSRVVK